MDELDDSRSGSDEDLFESDSFYTNSDSDDSSSEVDHSGKGKEMCFESDTSEEEDAGCLKAVTKQVVSQDTSDLCASYDNVSDSDWKELKVLIMFCDVKGIADWFSKRRVSSDEKKAVERLFSPLNIAASVGSLTVFNFLFAEGFGLDTARSPLLDAASSHNVKLMSRLLELRVDPNVVDPLNGQTALHMVAKEPVFKPKTIKCLLSNGANINQMDSSKTTPLGYAVLMGHRETVKYLLQCGAPANKHPSYSRSLLGMAIYRGIKMLKLLYEGGARPALSPEHNELLCAVRLADEQGVRFLLQVNVAVPDSIGMKGYRVLRSLQSLTLIELLLGAGYNPEKDLRAPLIHELLQTKNAPLHEKIKYAVTHPRSLQDLSCFKIREVLSGNRKPILDTVSELNIPNILKDYVLLKHLV